MNWRRGVLLAGIHFALAAASFIHDEVNYWPMIKRAAFPTESPQVRLAAFQEQRLPENVCDFGIYDSGPSTLANVVSAANLPVMVAIGWHSPCMPQLQRSRIINWIEGVLGGNTHRAEIVIDSCLSLGVLIQWLLVGGLPLIRPVRWWLDPAILVTFFAILGAVTAETRLSEFSRIAMLVIAVTWLWYFLLLLWKPVRPAWQSTLHGLQRLSN